MREISASRTGLRLDGVSKRFRGVQAVDGVSLQLAEGEVVGLIGPNGSGKTTLLNLASGVLRPTGGSVTVAGASATGLPPDRYARLGVARTFQQIRLFAGMTVEENVLVGALAKRVKADVGGLLRDLGLGDDAERDATTLSYGQQRRVEIARALAGAPRFLLLDEPAAGMNETESDELLAAIRRIRAERGCAVLIVDHDLRLIMRLCDRIHAVAEGRTIGTGTPEEIGRNEAVVQAYLGTANDQEREL